MIFYEKYILLVVSQKFDPLQATRATNTVFPDGQHCQTVMQRAITKNFGDFLIAVSLCDQPAALNPAILQIGEFGLFCDFIMLRAHHNLHDDDYEAKQKRFKLF